MNDYDYQDEPYFPPMDYAEEAFYMPDDPYQAMYLESVGDDPYPPPPMMDDWIPEDTTPIFDDDYPGPEQDGLQSQDQQFVDDAWRWDDTPPLDAIDPLLEQAFELGDVEMPTPEAPQSPTHSALDEIGLRLAYADLEPPMFTDEATNTHFWIGVFQPDTSDTENCITSILSLTPDENGGYQAQLAPCLVGDLETAHSNANFLMEKAQQGGMDYAFDAAEAMARGSQQHEIWQNERGIPMELEL